jgi:mannose-6-phosphate isomerase-like protein (cupin superfamily)
MTNGVLVNHHREDREYFFDEGCFINELLNTPQDSAVSIARARVAAGETTRWHRLQGITERYLIVSGQGTASIGDEDIVLTAGDVVVIPAGVRQRIRNTGDEVLEFLAIWTPRFVVGAYEDLEEGIS